MSLKDYSASVIQVQGQEFIDLQPLEINPLMSRCKIKVFYIGENRNKSYISKQVATEMAKTLRGAPIVGYYKEDKQDFGDHGEVVTIDDEGVHFDCKTIPYGFVAPDAKVWFEKFEEQSGSNPASRVVREYLVTEGFLWTGQFEEALSGMREKGQSMELDGSTLNGEWATSPNSNVEYFIINDAIISKLCILGDDVEPCFEGANVEVQFSKSEKDKQVSNTLFSMMKDLEQALKGDSAVEDENKLTLPGQEGKTVDFDNHGLEDSNAAAAPVVEPEEGNVVEPAVDDNHEPAAAQPEADPEPSVEPEGNEPEPVSADPEPEPEPVEETVSMEEYKALQEKFVKLTEDYQNAQEELNTLRAFKLDIDNKEKDVLIDKFSDLGEDVLANYRDNKDKYTFDALKSELSVLWFDKTHSAESEKVKEDESAKAAMTFSLNTDSSNEYCWADEIIAERKN